MTRRPLTSIVVVAAAVATTALAGPVSAATPGKRVDAKRAAVIVKGPTTTTTTVARYNGAPLGGGPGAATGAECRAYADAVNGIVDQIEQDLMAGKETEYDANGVIDGILGAGQARGCVFMTG